MNINRDPLPVLHRLVGNRRGPPALLVTCHSGRPGWGGAFVPSPTSRRMIFRFVVFLDPVEDVVGGN